MPWEFLWLRTGTFFVRRLLESELFRWVPRVLSAAFRSSWLPWGTVLYYYSLLVSPAFASSAATWTRVDEFWAYFYFTDCPPVAGSMSCDGRLDCAARSRFLKFTIWLYCDCAEDVFDWMSHEVGAPLAWEDDGISTGVCVGCGNSCMEVCWGPLRVILLPRPPPLGCFLW